MLEIEGEGTYEDLENHFGGEGPESWGDYKISSYNAGKPCVIAGNGDRVAVFVDHK